jgi:general secretion pathway protein G
LNRRGITLIEVAIVMVVLGIMASVALPAVRMSVVRSDELALKRELRQIREAIDRYFTDRDEESPDGIDALKYPPSLTELVEKRYLRRIPLDPMTNKAEWRLISSTDDPDSKVTNGDNVWDVRSLSEERSLDDQPYGEW